MPNDTTKLFKDGAIFKWRYQDVERHRQDLAYWAVSQIAILKDGWIEDTWSSSQPRTWLLADAQRLLKLNFVANLNDLEKTTPSNARYFNRVDIIDISHANSFGSQIYLKKGAEKCAETIHKLAEEYLSEKARDEEWAIRKHADAKEILSKIDAGQPIEEIYIPDWKKS